MTDNATIISKLNEISLSMKDLSSRVQNLEVNSSKQPQPESGIQNGASVNNCDNNTTAFHQISASPISIDGASADVQSEYERLKDSLIKVTIPKDYKVNDSAKGINKEGKPTLALISKCGRFAETGLKVLASLQPDGENEETLIIHKDDLQEFFTIFCSN